jgi:hypothetical protein
MPNELQEIARSGSWEEVCSRLGDYLNLDGPAPEAAVRRALDDPQYAFYLMFTREAPSLRTALLADPRNARYADPPPAEKSQRELIGSAFRALARWTASGFKTAPKEVVDRRWAACLACPHLVERPDRVLYNGMTILSGDSRVCSLCGCVAAAKGKLPTESCPAADPANPALTRWGEPRAEQ